MADGLSTEWTDATRNPVTGCDNEMLDRAAPAFEAWDATVEQQADERAELQTLAARWGGVIGILRGAS